jgi:hypothetical protein
VILGLSALSHSVSAQIEIDVADASAASEVSPTPDHPLVSRSPFLPAGFNADRQENPRDNERNRAGPLAQRYEFRGYYQLNGEFRFLIREKNKSAGRWVKLNDPAADYLVERFDESSGEIRLREGSQTESIALIKLDANAAPMPVSGQPPAVSPTNPGNNPNNVADTRRSRPIPPGATPTEPRPAAQRRTPPPPPQWLQNRLAERGVDAAAITAEIEAGPPNFIPPPPPAELPPGVPPSGGGDGSSTPQFPGASEMGTPPSGTPPGLPPGMSIPEAPNFTPPPPPGMGG